MKISAKWNKKFKFKNLLIVWRCNFNLFSQMSHDVVYFTMNIQKSLNVFQNNYGAYEIL